MRQALNENPMVQMAVLVLCGVVLAFIVFTSVLKKDDSSVAATSTTADPAAATAAVDPAAATATPDPAAVAPAATPPAETGTVAPPAGSGEIEAGDGLPKDVLAAYEGGKAIALVVIDPKSEDSFKWVRATKDLNEDDVKVFVVEVDDIAKYSRITQGVSVSRTPALIVVTPRKLSGGVPMATVTYGFRSPQSAKQAINDAFYEGGNVPAYPSG